MWCFDRILCHINSQDFRQSWSFNSLSRQWGNLSSGRRSISMSLNSSRPRVSFTRVRESNLLPINSLHSKSIVTPNNNLSLKHDNSFITALNRQSETQTPAQETTATAVWVRFFSFPVSVFHRFPRWRRMRIESMSDVAFPGVIRRKARGHRVARGEWVFDLAWLIITLSSSLGFKAN